MAKAIAVIIFALSIVSCSSGASGGYTPPTSTPNNGMAGLFAAGTSTAVSASVTRTAKAHEADTMSTAHAANVTSTAQANATATMVAAGNATATRQQEIVSTTATAQFVAQETAVAFEHSIEQIELSALKTRTYMETAATVTAIAVKTTEDLADQKRGEWVADLFWIVCLFIVLLSGTGFGVWIWKNARTVRDADGTVIAYAGEVLLPTDAPVIVDQEPPRQIPHTANGSTRAIHATRRPFRLTDKYGDQIYQFSGSHLDAMEKNALNGDTGFRRETSTAGLGLNEMAEVTNGKLFSAILAEMKRRHWVKSEGNGNAWTAAGLYRVLEINPPR